MRRYIHPATLFGVYSMAGALPLFALSWAHDSSAGVLRELGIATGLLALSLLLQSRGRCLSRSS